MKDVYKFCKGCRKYSGFNDNEICMTFRFCDKYSAFVGTVFRQRKCRKQNKKIYKALLEELRR